MKKIKFFFILMCLVCLTFTALCSGAQQLNGKIYTLGSLVMNGYKEIRGVCRLDLSSGDAGLLTKDLPVNMGYIANACIDSGGNGIIFAQDEGLMSSYPKKIPGIVYNDFKTSAERMIYPLNRLIVFPRLSPQGDKLVFNVYIYNPEKDLSTNELWILNLKNRQIERKIKIKMNYGGTFNISWFPDGKKIVYNVRKGNNEQEDDIVVMDIETGGIKKITTGRRPVVSPDGKKLAFAPCREEIGGKHPDREIDILDLETNEIIKKLKVGGISLFSEGITWFRWSPDSKHIAYHLLGPAHGFYPYGTLKIISIDGKYKRDIGKIGWRCTPLEWTK